MKKGAEICLITRTHQVLSARPHRRLACGWLRAGYRASVICRVAHDHPPLNETIDGVQYIGIPYPSVPRRDVRRTLQIFRQAWRRKADIYVGMELRTLIMALLLKRLRGAQAIYDCHEYRPERYLGLVPSARRQQVRTAVWRLERFLASRCDAVWTVNEHLAERFRPHCHNLAVLPNYPLFDSFRQIPPPPHEWRARCAGRKVLIYAGGMSAERGISACLQVVAHLRAQTPEVLMLFIGQLGSDYARQVTRLVDELSLRDSVAFLGWLPADEVPPYLTLGDLGLFLVQPVNERFDWGEPIKFFEYAAAGLPVVLSDLPAKRRLVQEVGNGILVDPLDYAATARAIADLLRDDARRAEMARRGREAFLSHLNWQAVEPQMLASLRALEDGASA
ncbi:MAG: glycosyltransferase family 4 protein [Chloroflexota bacterium]